jgi:hemerythrin-like domain-containing protein
MNGAFSPSHPASPENFAQARRALLGAAAATAFALVGCARHESGEAEVTPGEDLMQEHGLLERVLLVYDEAARRIDAKEPLDLGVISGAAGIVRRFVEQYHEQNEEKFVFPRLQAAGRELELVGVLLRQHERGRQVTEEVLRKVNAGASTELSSLLRSFVRMYRPHAAREDTVLFPAFREVIGGSAYRELGEQLEDEEHRRFGELGFEKTVSEVLELEKKLDLADLAKFSP